MKVAPRSCLGRTLATLTMTPDGRAWAAQWVIPQQDLYLIDGLR